MQGARIPPTRLRLQFYLGLAVRRPRLSGLFYVSSRCACIAVRGRRNTRLIAAGATARRRPLGTAPADAGRGGILELLAHAIELSRVIRAETTAGLSRPLTVTSTTTTHRPVSIPKVPERTFHRHMRGGVPAGRGGCCRAAAKLTCAGCRVLAGSPCGRAGSAWAASGRSSRSRPCRSLRGPRSPD
jgi:hypothetical protein